MCQHRSNSRLFRDQECTPDGILQESESNPSSMVLRTDRQPRQNDNRQWILAHAFANALRYFQSIDLTDSKAEVASNPVVIGHNKGPGRPTGLRLTRVAQQPFIERGLAAIKFFQLMADG